ncbi:MAG: haloacid dehalogenase-like hydrolase, partial [Candidatus Adiutrix sp.]
DNLLFKATPKEFAVALRHEVPKDNFTAEYNNSEGQAVNIDLVAADLDATYAFLYDNYIKDQKKSLEEIVQTPQFVDFRGKLAYLYEAIGGTFSAEISYPWMNYLFAGMTVQELRQAAELGNDYGLNAKLEYYTIESSKELPGKAGVVSLSDYKRGLRIAPEMSNLMNVLRENGIDVYVCSASHEAVVRVFAGLDKYGYRVPDENVIAMKTKMKNGKFLPEYDHSNDYPQTQQKGKTIALEQILVKKYGYGPLLIAGDSQGDYNMSVDFPDTKLTIMVNRVRSDDFGKLGLEAVKQKGQADARFILQGRDENTGQFRPSHATIKLGTTEEQLLHKSLQ